ncbi:MAG: amidohydrolase family protein [Acidobacteria bacterium]|nr:amidohydrolase family protein [Acidobacteriota bacterium]
MPQPAAYGAFPRILSRLVRSQNLLTFEEAIRKMTSFPATIFGLKDRGTIRPGAFADLVILDPLKISDHATYKNPRRQATGIHSVIINGYVYLEEDEFIGGLNGKLIIRS